MRHFKSIVFLFFILFVASCAIQVAPEGGPKDLSPPHLISSEPENFSTSFDKHDIILNFDEFIALNDLNAQLVVSPLLKYPPETKIRKKSLVIHLEDTLLENTTYSMNFGEGITDNNEGNKLENFQYVFSTGSIIDSLSITGKIVKAFDQKTEKGILALLYKGTYDSLPYLERPVYFSRTNDAGEFHISNISPGKYKLIALKESDGNYIYSEGDEMIAFSDSLVMAGTHGLNLMLFSDAPRLRFLRAYSEFPGKAAIVFSAPADTIILSWLTDTTKLDIFSVNYSKGLDTITFWYKNVLADSLSLRFNNKNLNDTITLRLFKIAEGSSGGRKKEGMTLAPGNAQTLVQHLYLPYFLQSNRPIVKAEFNKIVFLEDSIPIHPEYSFTDSLHMQISVKYPWKNKGNYSVFIPPVSFTDFLGTWNDTIRISFTSHSETDYGSVKINFKTADSESYIVQLVDETGVNVIREFLTSSDKIYEFNNLDPRIYKVKLIIDRNKNGKWDTGDYLNHVQPEETAFYPESITVRANWDVDVTIKVPFLPEIKK